MTMSTKSSSESKFPKTLYVYKPLDPRDPFTGHVEYQSAQEEEIIAIYHLVEVCRVKHTKIVILEKQL